MTDAPPAPEQGATEQALKAKAISARRAALPAWQNAHHDRLAREQQARQVAREYRRRPFRDVPEGHRRCSKCEQVRPLDSFKPRGKAGGARHSHCKPCVNAAARARHVVKPRVYKSKPTGPTPEQLQRKADRQREAAERIAHLTSLLMGTNPTERISSEQGWDMTTSELQRLWHQSGDKECVSCNAVVPPSAMLPPGPANFYPGRCRSCAAVQYREVQWIMFGKEPAAPLIPMLDGSSITIATFARRVREREQSYRSNDP